MAKRGSQKQASLDQETFVARNLDGGKVTRNTGAGDIEKGDVVLHDVRILLECKLTGALDKPAKSISIKLADLEKIEDEAQTIGYSPGVAIRIINPDSPIADRSGHVDYVLVPLSDFGHYLEHGGNYDG